MFKIAENIFYNINPSSPCSSHATVAPGSVGELAPTEVLKNCPRPLRPVFFNLRRHELAPTRELAPTQRWRTVQQSCVGANFSVGAKICLKKAVFYSPKVVSNAGTQIMEF
jgi:hypothetical protein